jgi:hypothetical protein
MLSTIPASPPPPYDAHVPVVFHCPPPPIPLAHPASLPARRAPQPDASAWAFPAVVLGPGRSLLPPAPAPTPEETLLAQVCTTIRTRQT